MKTNKVYLIGAGPGRPDLITVRGLDILRSADVVIYDYLIDKKLLDEVRPGARVISCRSLGKKCYYGDSIKAQKKISELVVKEAKKGKRVVRIKNGDPSIFSRVSEEIEALVKNRIEFEIVPGVTAASAAAAFTGALLIDRNSSSSVVILTGREAQDRNKTNLDWKAIACFNTIVIYMGVNNLSRIVNKLIKAGKSKYTPVVVVSEAGGINQKTLRAKLENIAEKVKIMSIPAPAIFIIGKTVELENDFNWLRKTKKVLFTGLSKERFFMDATYYHLPLINIGPLDDYREFDGHLKKIKAFDWIVFASRYGVEYFFKRFKKIKYDSRVLSNINIAAVGNSTRSRLLDFGISADLVPQKESSEGLIKEFQKINLKGKKIFLPRSDISDKGLEKALKSLGAVVTSSFAYKNRITEDLPDIDMSGFDKIMFTSPSTVRNFKARYGDLPGTVKVECIGDRTLREAKRCQLLD